MVTIKMLIAVCCALVVGSNLPAQSVQHVELDEVGISERSLSAIIRTVSKRVGAKLPQNKFPVPSYYSSALCEKIVESKGRTVQYDRDYGVYVTTGNVRCHTVWDLRHNSHLCPVYSTRSYKLTCKGDDTLRTCFLSNNGNHNSSFDADRCKIFDAMRALTLWGPIFSNPKFYTYKLIRNDDTHYVISFASRPEYYPEKNRASCNGRMRIAKDSLTLEDMEIDDFTYQLYQSPKRCNKWLCPTHTTLKVRFTQVNGAYLICQCDMETTWKHSPTGDGYRGLEMPSRPYPYKNELVEKEAFLAFRLSQIPSEMQSALPSCLIWGNRIWLENNVIGAYNPEVFKKLPHLLDCTKAEKELSQYRPIEEQYATADYRGILFLCPPEVMERVKQRTREWHDWVRLWIPEIKPQDPR